MVNELQVIIMQKVSNGISLHDLIVEIHELDKRFQTLEARYSLPSDDFFHLYEAGHLRDEEVEEIDEFGQWAALYRMRKRRVARSTTPSQYPFTTEHASTSQACSARY